MEFNICHAFLCVIAVAGKHLNCFFAALHLWLHQSVDEFILGLGIKEVNADKQRKISALVLSEEEWTRVRLFCNILQVRSTLTEVTDD